MTSRLHMRPRIGAAACAAVVIALAACGATGGTRPPSSPSTEAGVQTAPVAVIRLAAQQGNYGFPTRFAALRGPGMMLAAEIFDQLVWPDATGKQQPWLAKSWKTSADGLTWAFTLRSGVTFQDGTPLTADDVVFSFQYVMKGGPGNAVAPAPPSISSVTSPSADTVVITLGRPDPVFLDEIGSSGGVAIIPKHIWATVTDPVKFTGPTSLIGSGPYRLAQYDLTAGSYQFVANNSFFLGPPKVQQLLYLPTGTADPLLLLQQGQIDAGSGHAVAVPAEQMKALSAKFTVLTAPGEQGTHLYFNVGKGFPYNNRDFRQAVAYAVNRPDMISRELLGRGVPGSTGGLGPSNPWLDKSLPEYTFNLTKAKSLLTQAGLVDTDGNGMRNLPGGGDLHVPLLTSSTDIDAAQLVAEYLRAAGLQVDVQSVDQTSMDATAKRGGYSMAVIHFGGLAADPGTGLCGRVSAGMPAAFTTAQGYDNATVDALCTQIQTTIDHATRAKLINQLQAIINQDVPILPLFLSDQLTFVDMKVFKAWAYTPACPPCGATNNKFMLATGRTTYAG